jgi:hypothetical protein
MKYRIPKSIARVLSAKPDREDLHFHLDSDGRPFVCDIACCESPAVSHREVGLIRN